MAFWARYFVSLNVLVAQYKISAHFTSTLTNWRFWMDEKWHFGQHNSCISRHTVSKYFPMDSGLP